MSFINLRNLFFFCLLLSVAQVEAGQRWSRHIMLAERDEGISLDRAVTRARGRVDGRVLSAETDERGGRRTHNIRILTKDGKVRRLRVDAESGEFVGKRR
jgi:uncharacterized membrane protein YkoI